MDRETINQAVDQTDDLKILKGLVKQVICAVFDLGDRVCLLETVFPPSKKRFSQRQRKSINFHLARLGVAGAYVPDIDKNKRRKPGEPRRTLLERMEPYEVLFEAEQGYKKMMRHCHPDHGGDDEYACELNDSIVFVRKWAKYRGVKL